MQTTIPTPSYYTASPNLVCCDGRLISGLPTSLVSGSCGAPRIRRLLSRAWRDMAIFSERSGTSIRRVTLLLIFHGHRVNPQQFQSLVWESVPDHMPYNRYSTLLRSLSTSILSSDKRPATYAISRFISAFISLPAGSYGRFKHGRYTVGRILL